MLVIWHGLALAPTTFEPLIVKGHTIIIVERELELPSQ